MLAGDFNTTVHPSESSNFSQDKTADMRDFIDLRNQISIFDHVSLGPLFTWNNKHQEAFLAKKLDRVLVNENWSSSFPNLVVEFLAPEMSDHCPGFIKL
ncbi:hypothetical protein DITRI_Ditri13aG0077500 [Diplodiscus trichospermus]